MTLEKRNTYSASFKSKVALEALKESKTLAELSLEFNVHAALIDKWRLYLLKEGAQIFDESQKKTECLRVEPKSLFVQINKIQAQIAFLKEKTD